MKNIPALIAKVAFLKIPPEAYDAIYPQGPDFPQAMIEYFAANVVSVIGKSVHDRGLQSKLQGIARQLAATAASGLISSLDDDPDICPPYPPFPWPFPFPFTSDPSPEPWRVRAVETVVFADLLVSIAGVTTNAEVSAELKDVSVSLVTNAASQLTRDFEGLQVTPRSVSAGIIA